MSWYLAAVLGFTALLGGFIFALVPSGRWRIAGVATYVMLVAVIFAGAIDGLGRAKPLPLEWRRLAGDQIIAFIPVEGKEIFVWVVHDGAPLSIILPWNAKHAQELQDGIARMGDGGGDLQFSDNIDGTPDAPGNGEITKTLPPKSLPPKSG
jgi:hypothetical protein